MTEAERNSCEDPEKLLKWLRSEGKLSERKLRLFAVACCRRVWPLLTDERSRTAVEVAERYADGQASEEELTVAGTAAWDAARQQLRLKSDSAEGFGAAARTTWLPELDFFVFWQASVFLSEIRSTFAAGQGDLQCAMLRDLVVNPFGDVPVISPSCLAWNEGCVPRLVHALYEERYLPEGTIDATRLTVLADALEEAGCTDQEILSHCRSGSDHVRGCWLLDLILGKA
jgi:hypothetical protein